MDDSEISKPDSIRFLKKKSRFQITSDFTVYTSAA